jgi:hypothetical protein
MFCHGQAKRHIQAYEQHQDGMRAWSAIIQEFDMGGVTTTYHRDYAGGLIGFVCTYKDTFVELEMLDVLHAPKKHLPLMLRNLMIPAQTDWMVSHCEDKEYKNNFKDACCWLKGKDAWQVCQWKDSLHVHHDRVH